MRSEERMELEKEREGAGVGPAVGVVQQLNQNPQVVRDGGDGEREGGERGVGIQNGKAGNEGGTVDSSMESVSVGCLTGVCPNIWGKVSDNIVMAPSKGHFRWR